MAPIRPVRARHGLSQSRLDGHRRAARDAPRSVCGSPDLVMRVSDVGAAMSEPATALARIPPHSIEAEQALLARPVVFSTPGSEKPRCNWNSARRQSRLELRGFHPLLDG